MSSAKTSDNKYHDLLSSKLNDLSQEALELSQRKLEYEQHIKDLEVRLTQIVGAIQAIDSILSENK